MSRSGAAALAVAMVTWSSLMSSSSGSPREIHAKRLHDHMLQSRGYNKLIRPVSNTSESLTVLIGLRLTSIIDVVSSPTGRPSGHFPQNKTRVSRYKNVFVPNFIGVKVVETTGTIRRAKN